MWPGPSACSIRFSDWGTSLVGEAQAGFGANYAVAQSGG